MSKPCGPSLREPTGAEPVTEVRGLGVCKNEWLPSFWPQKQREQWGIRRVLELTAAAILLRGNENKQDIKILRKASSFWNVS